MNIQSWYSCICLLPADRRILTERLRAWVVISGSALDWFSSPLSLTGVFRLLILCPPLLPYLAVCRRARSWDLPTCPLILHSCYNETDCSKLSEFKLLAFSQELVLSVPPVPTLRCSQAVRQNLCTPARSLPPLICDSCRHLPGIVAVGEGMNRGYDL